MKRLAMLFGVFLLLTPYVSNAYNLLWDAVKTYTDGSQIEAGKTVLYNVERGGTVVSAKQPAITFTFTSGKGTAESFRVQTELNTGEKSAWSPAYSWTSPLGTPDLPPNLRVAP